VHPNKQTVAEYGATIISCSAHGPVLWAHNGKFITENLIYLEMLDNFLIIHLVSTLSEGYYSCYASVGDILVFMGTSVLEASRENLFRIHGSLELLLLSEIRMNINSV